MKNKNNSINHIKQYYKYLYKGKILPNFIISLLLLILVDKVDQKILDYISQNKVVIVCLVVLGLLLLIYFIIMYMEPFKNVIDYLLVDSVLTLILLLFYNCLTAKYYFSALFVVLSILLFFLLNRTHIVAIEEECIEKDSIIDFKEIYDNKIELDDYNDCVIVEENAANYDLLNRREIIDRLSSYIFDLNTNKNYTIGINGEWGSGKTTIINNAINSEKNKKNNIIVEFNPCVYNDDELMLEAFLNKALGKMGIMSNTTNHLIQEIISSFIEQKSSFLQNIYNNTIKTYSREHTDRLKEIVDNYLIYNNKTLIIIVDNLDRIEPLSIVRLISFLEIAVKFTKTRIVLLYDRQIINKIFMQEFSFGVDFINKYITIELNVPVISDDNMEDIKKKISENILYKGKPHFSFLQHKYIQFQNFRDFKKFLNELLFHKIFRMDIINKIDLELLLYIQYYSPSLYYEIYKNRKYYIKDDDSWGISFYSSDDSRTDLIKEYFEGLFRNHVDYSRFKPIICYLFPDVSEYIPNSEEYLLDCIVDEDNNENNENRIRNKDFFDFYFSYTQSDYVKMYYEVQQFIELINNNQLSDKDLIGCFDNKNSSELGIYLSILYSSLDKIKSHNIEVLIKYFYSKLKDVPNEHNWKSPNPENQLIYIIAKLLTKVNWSMDKIKNELFNEDDNLFYISEIDEYYNRMYHQKTKYTDNYHEYFNNRCIEILDDNNKDEANKNYIDIMSKDKYKFRCLYGLIRKRREKISKYIKTIVNKENVLNILREFIVRSELDNAYFLRPNDLIEFASGVDFDALLPKNEDGLTENEKIVYEAYKRMKENNEENKNLVYRKTVADFRIV